MTTNATMTGEAERRREARDEPLPFTISLQDVFLTLGVLIFVSGVAITLPLLVGGLTMTEGGGPREIAASAGVQAALMLGLLTWLSQVLVGERRRSLPGIPLSVGFVATATGLYVAWAVAVVPSGLVDGSQWQSLFTMDFLIGAEAEETPSDASLRAFANGAMAAIPLTARLLFLGLSVVGLIAALGYYRAFALPFAMGLVGTAAVGLVWCVLLLLFPYDVIRLDPVLTLGTGLGLLAAAIAYDARDPERVTNASKNAFWLHLVAAPAVLEGAINLAVLGPSVDLVALAQGTMEADPFGVRQSVVTLIVIAVLSVIALLLNRRALVVAGLITAGFAIGALFWELKLGGAVVTAATLTVLGGGVLLLGIGWQAARRALLAPLPDEGPLARIFPPAREGDEG